MNLTKNQQIILISIITMAIIYFVYKYYKKENIAAYVPIDLCNKNNNMMDIFDSYRDVCEIQLPKEILPKQYSFVSKVHTPVLVDTVSPDPRILNKPILTNIINSMPKNLKAVVSTEKYIPKTLPTESQLIQSTQSKQLIQSIQPTQPIQPIQPKQANLEKIFLASAQDII
jgi:hypothetical protein